MIKQYIVVLPLIILAVPVYAEGDPIEGKKIYETCAACHGQNGEGSQDTNAPRLAGLRSWYLVGQLEKFRSGLRGADPKNVFGSQMAAVAKSLPDEKSFRDVASFINTFVVVKAPRTELTGDPARGLELSRYCLRCHGERGQGYKAPKIIKYRSHYGPRLAGQHDWYLIRQIQNFRDGLRGSNEDKPTLYMQSEVKSLTKEQDILDLVAYIGTLE